MFDSAIGEVDWIISEESYLFPPQLHLKGTRNKTPSLDVIKRPPTERFALEGHLNLNVFDQKGGRNPRVVDFWYPDLSGEFHRITYPSAKD